MNEEKTNGQEVCYRNGFEIHPNYWGEENQDKAPDEVEPLPAAAHVDVKRTSKTHKKTSIVSLNIR